MCLGEIADGSHLAYENAKPAEKKLARQQRKVFKVFES